MELICVGGWCRESATGIADVETPDGRKLKPLCKYHLKEFKTGLVHTKADLKRRIAGGDAIARLGADDYLLKLEAVRILTLEEGLEVAQGNPGLLVGQD